MLKCTNENGCCAEQKWRVCRKCVYEKLPMRDGVGGIFGGFLGIFPKGHAAPRDRVRNMPRFAHLARIQSTMMSGSHRLRYSGVSSFPA